MFKTFDYKQWTLLFIMLLSISFFGLKLFDPETIIIIEYACVTIFLFYYLPCIKSQGMFSEGKFLNAYFFFFFVSCIYSVLFNGQNPSSMYHDIIDYIGIATFSICYTQKTPSFKVKKMLLIIAILFSICYIVQWLAFPKIIFKGANDCIDKNYFRMRLPCSLSCYYLFLTGIEKAFFNKFVKAVIFILLGGVPILIMGFRSLFILSIASAIILYFLYGKLSVPKIFVGIVLAVLSIAISNTSLFNSKLEEMMERQVAEQTFSNDDYIRWLAFDYFQRQCDKPGEWLFGGGIPCGSSNYAQSIVMSREYGMYWEDLGLIGLSFMIGIITVCILVIWSLRMIGRCGHSSMYVERMTMFIALFGSIMTSMEYFRSGNFMILGFLFYYEYIRNIELGAPKDKLFLTKNNYIA